MQVSQQAITHCRLAVMSVQIDEDEGAGSTGGGSQEGDPSGTTAGVCLYQCPNPRPHHHHRIIFPRHTLLRRLFGSTWCNARPTQVTLTNRTVGRNHLSRYSFTTTVLTLSTRGRKEQ